MSKTVPISDEVHGLIIKKQEELEKDYKVTMKISDIIGDVVQRHIEELIPELGLKKMDKNRYKKNDK